MNRRPSILAIVLDDVHHIEDEAHELLGALLQISTKTPLRIIMISRTKPTMYDRRDVHTRELVAEFSLKGLANQRLNFG